MKELYGLALHCLVPQVVIYTFAKSVERRCKIKCSQWRRREFWFGSILYTNFSHFARVQMAVQNARQGNIQSQNSKYIFPLPTQIFIFANYVTLGYILLCISNKPEPIHWPNTTNIWAVCYPHWDCAALPHQFRIPLFFLITYFLHYMQQKVRSRLTFPM